MGTVLARAFHGQGHEVVVLSRSPKPLPWRACRWEPRHGTDGAAVFDGSDVVINLVGRSVNCRYNAKNCAAIINSRVDSVHAVGHALARAARPPRLWLQMSTATIYSHRYDAANDEKTGSSVARKPALRRPGASA